MISGKQTSDLSPAGPGWNEVDFVPWRSFRRMAPSILNLEVTRLGSLIGRPGSLEFRNALVKSRYELATFIGILQEEGPPEKLDTVHLTSAIVNLPLGYPGIDSETARTLAYILDRLQYVHNRIRFVYQ